MLLYAYKMEVEPPSSTMGHILVNQLNSGLQLGFNAVERLFVPQAQITLGLYHLQHTEINEMIGFHALKNKFNALGVYSLYYHQYQFTCQQVHSSYCITMHGTIVINNQPFAFFNTIVFNKQNWVNTITHFVLHVMIV